MNRYTLNHKRLYFCFFVLFQLSLSCTSDVPSSPSESLKPSWIPQIQDSWQYQLDSPNIELSIDARVFFIDLFDVDTATIKSIHASGRFAVCYFSAGSWESWRPDAKAFPSFVIGNDYEGWPGEKWLDIRQIDVLGPIMTQRIKLCKQKGFDGVDPDNVNGYLNVTGFPLTFEDQLRYNLWLAEQAHKQGLWVGLKNDGEQTLRLVHAFDWSVVEDCFYYDECHLYQTFIESGKPVFSVEYTDTGITLKDFCPKAKERKFSAILKHRNLDAFLQKCSQIQTWDHPPIAFMARKGLWNSSCPIL